MSDNIHIVVTCNPNHAVIMRGNKCHTERFVGAFELIGIASRYGAPPIAIDVGHGENQQLLSALRDIGYENLCTQETILGPTK